MRIQTACESNIKCNYWGVFVHYKIYKMMLHFFFLNATQIISNDKTFQVTTRSTLNTVKLFSGQDMPMQEM